MGEVVLGHQLNTAESVTPANATQSRGIALPSLDLIPDSWNQDK